MKKNSFHILFWVFIALYVFDYIIDIYDIKQSIVYTVFETAIYATEFYINLLILLPFVLEKRGKLLYGIGVIFLFIICFGIVIITGLNEGLLSPNLPRAIASFLLNNSLFIVISYFVWYFNKFEQEKQKRLQLENEKLQTEMMLLKSQISPHFLFNTLNNIYTLTLLNNDNAPKMLSALSEILRYFIYDGNKQTVFLDSEIEVVSKYIQLQKYRQIAGMNNINFDIIGNVSGLKVPPLLFMTLVENAFKHSNIIDNINGFVAIKFEVKDTAIVFSISNSFETKQTNEGVGLNNIKSQLDILYPKNYNLNICNKNNQFNVDLQLNAK